ncbi:AMP-binding protein [Streptomyces globosus]|uniref:AMP-binding protein n=1 Tax=Streptomyces globosus TaxID=68209 RepID=UPI003634FF3A
MAVHVHDYLTTPGPADPGGAWTTPRPTLPDVFAAAVAAGGGRTAVVDAGGARSWQAWRADADAFGRALQDLGVRPGDVVAAQLPNSWEFLVAHVAVAAVGAVLLPLHSTLGTRETGSLLERTGARALLLPAAAEPPARSDLPALEFVIPVGPGGDAAVPDGAASDAADAADSYEALVRARRGLAPQPVPVTADMPLVLMPSSGTTSARPKICIHTHGGLLGNAVTAAREGGTTSGDTLLSGSPFTHLFGLFSVHLSLVAAARQAVLPRWDTGAVRQLAAASRASVLFAVPAQLRDLVESPDPVARFREVRTGGAAVPASLVAGVRSALGAATVVQWGMSEVGAGLSTAPDDPVGVAARSIGRPVGEGRVRVVGEDGRPCPVGETGALEFHGPSLFRGYLADPEATGEAMTPDGWLRTGDLACRYEDGTIGYRGRQAERINVGGLKFTASEIEALLADLPQLANAAVAARPDDRLGEYPVLLAQLRTGARLTLEDVRAHLAAKGVAAYKWPLELVTVAEVPVTPTRKVARGRLAALLALPARKTVAAWAQQAALLPEREALDAALALVRELAAEVGGAALGAGDGGRSFRSAGLDSLGAVRLASGLGARTGLALSTTAVFDHPTPEQLARHLVALAAGAADGPGGAAADTARRAPTAGRGGGDDDPIAVVGIGCRFPGGIASPEDLWRLLAEGGETVGPFPADRGWDLERLHHPDRGRAGTSYVRHGGFLDGAADFDAAFFGLSPARPGPWIPSSGCSWRRPGRRWNGPGSPDRAARHRCRGLRRPDVLRLRAAPGGGARAARRAAAHRQRLQRGRGPDLLRPRADRSRAHRGHRLLLLPGGPAPGPAGAAARRVHGGPGRRGDRDVDAGVVRGLQPAGRPLAGRPLPGVLRRGGRGRLVGGRGRPRPGAAVGGAPGRAAGPGRAVRLGGQPGRRQQRADRAERPGPAGGGPPGARRRLPGTGRCRPGRGARHRHPAGRPDRSGGAAGLVRAGPRRRPAGVAGLAQVEHRAHAGRGGRGRGDQGRTGAAARRDAPLAARRGADAARRLGCGRGAAARRAPAVAAPRGRAPPGRGRLRLRHQRHQRPCPRPGPAAGRGRAPHRRHACRAGAGRGRAVGAGGEGPARLAGTRGAPRPVGGRRRTRGRGPGAGRAPGPRRPRLPAARRRRRRRRRRAPRRARGPGRRPGEPARRHRGAARCRTRPDGVRLPRAGRPVGGDGSRAAARVPGVRGGRAGLRRRVRTPPGLVGGGRAARRGRHAAGGPRRRGADRAVHDDGVAGGAVAVARRRAGRRGRALAGRDRRRVHRRGADPAGRGADRRPPCAGGAPAASRGDGGRVAPGPGARGPPGGPGRAAAGGRRGERAGRLGGRRGALRRRRAAGGALRGGGAGAARGGGLRLALRGRGTAAGGAVGGPGRPRPAAGVDAVLVDGGRRPDQRAGAHRRLLVREPAQPGRVRPCRRVPAGVGVRYVRGGEPAPGAHVRGAGDGRAGGRGRARRGQPAARRRRARTVPAVGGRGVRPRRGGGLGGGVRRPPAGAGRGAPDVPVPAPAVLAGGSGAGRRGGRTVARAGLRAAGRPGAGPGGRGCGGRSPQRRRTAGPGAGVGGGRAGARRRGRRGPRPAVPGARGRFADRGGAARAAGAGAGPVPAVDRGLRPSDGPRPRRPPGRAPGALPAAGRRCRGTGVAARPGPGRRPGARRVRGGDGGGSAAGGPARRAVGAVPAGQRGGPRGGRRGCAVGGLAAAAVVHGGGGRRPGAGPRTAGGRPRRARPGVPAVAGADGRAARIRPARRRVRGAPDGTGPAAARVRAGRGAARGPAGPGRGTRRGAGAAYGRGAGAAVRALVGRVDRLGRRRAPRPGGPPGGRDRPARHALVRGRGAAGRPLARAGRRGAAAPGGGRHRRHRHPPAHGDRRLPARPARLAAGTARRPGAARTGPRADRTAGAVAASAHGGRGGRGPLHDDGGSCRGDRRGRRVLARRKPQRRRTALPRPPGPGPGRRHRLRRPRPGRPAAQPSR